MKRFAVVVGLALASLVGWHSTSHAFACGWCDFQELCRSEPNTGFCCIFVSGGCLMGQCPACNVLEIEGGGREISAAITLWKTHEPRLYTSDAAPTILSWKGRGTIPPALLERYKARPEQMKSPILAEALRQRTHYDAMRLLAKAGALGDNQALVDALLR